MAHDATDLFTTHNSLSARSKDIITVPFNSNNANNTSDSNNHKHCTSNKVNVVNENNMESSVNSNFIAPRDKSFGWGKFQPKFLQRFCTAKWALFWLCWGGAMQGLIVNGFINVVISTIERRFGLRSRQTGLVASGYDIASFICLVPVTYFGGRLGSSKPRFIAWGIILMGLGSLTFALPHFLVDSYRATMTDNNVCEIRENITSLQSCDAATFDSTGEKENLSWTVWLFFLAQLLHGAGASPLFTLGVTYIDENVSRKMSSVYLGIYYTMAIIGPALGYVLGGQLLLIYTDFISVDAAALGLTSSSNVWIGAWWIGFVFAAAACVLLAIPVFAYPRSLPGAETLQQQKVSEAYNADGHKQSTQNFTKLQELPSALLSLLKNPTFFCLNLAGATEGLVIAGFAAFLPKQIENQFSISPVWSALLMGLITVPAGGGGTFLGGYLIKKWNLNCAQIIKMCLTMTFIAACFTSCFLLSCPNMAFAGVTAQYRQGAISQDTIKNLTDGDNVEWSYLGVQLESTCNAHCTCNKLDYEPVCGADGVLYYSPCFAGCVQQQNVNNIKTYANCSCVERELLSPMVPDATNTMCSSSCRYLPHFVALCFVLMLFTFLSTMPALSATLRCVHDDQRSFALGIQWIKVRLLGTIPAPMIFGALIDESCILWQETCDGSAEGVGACLVYDNYYISKYMWLLALVGKTLSVIFFFGAWWFYIPPKKSADNSDGDASEDNDNNSALNINNSAGITTVVNIVAE